MPITHAKGGIVMGYRTEQIQVKTLGYSNQTTTTGTTEQESVSVFDIDLESLDETTKAQFDLDGDGEITDAELQTIQTSIDQQAAAPQTKEEQVQELSKQLKAVQAEQGIIGKGINFVKCIFGQGSDKCEQAIRDFKDGKISYEEASETISGYQSNQSTVSGIVKGIATAGVVIAALGSAVATGGATLPLILAGAGIAGGTSVGLNLAERATNDINNDALDAGQMAKDFAHGAVDGAITVATMGTASVAKAGVSSTVETGLAETTEVVLEEGVKQTAKKGILSRIGSKIFKKGAEEGVETVGKHLIKDGVKTGFKQGFKAGAISSDLHYGVDILAGDAEFSTEELLARTVQGGAVGGTIGGITGGISGFKAARANLKGIADGVDEAAVNSVDDAVNNGKNAITESTDDVANASNGNKTGKPSVPEKGSNSNVVEQNGSKTIQEAAKNTLDIPEGFELSDFKSLTKDAIKQGDKLNYNGEILEYSGMKDGKFIFREINNQSNIPHYREFNSNTLQKAFKGHNEFVSEMTRLDNLNVAEKIGTNYEGIFEQYETGSDFVDPNLVTTGDTTVTGNTASVAEGTASPQAAKAGEAGAAADSASKGKLTWAKNKATQAADAVKKTKVGKTVSKVKKSVTGKVHKAGEHISDGAKAVKDAADKTPVAKLYKNLKSQYKNTNLGKQMDELAEHTGKKFVVKLMNKGADQETINQILENFGSENLKMIGKYQNLAIKLYSANVPISQWMTHIQQEQMIKAQLEASGQA